MDYLIEATMEPDEETLELGKLGALIDGHAEAIGFRGFTVCRPNPFTLRIESDTGAVIGARAVMDEPLNELHEWIETKVAANGGAAR